MNPAIAYTLAFLMAFCSLTYELLVASELSFLMAEGIFIFPVSMGVFILFMGLGSALWYKLEDTPLGVRDVNYLIPLEILLALLGLASIITIDLSAASREGGSLNYVVVGLFFSAAIGFFSGQELPLIFRLCSRMGLEGSHVRNVVFADYLASLAASLTLVWILFPNVGLIQGSFAVAFVNWLILVALLFRLETDRRGVRAGGIAVAVALFAAFVAIGAQRREIDRHVVSIGIGREGDVLLEKFNTRYQRVMLFAGRRDIYYLEEDPQEIFERPEDYHIYGFLNWAVQFDNVVTEPSDTYHVALLDPFVRLMPNLRKVLILGGGDGLPARQAVQYDQLTEIQMVDLDSQWVEFSRTNPYMRLVNADALNHPKLSLDFGDAFKWVATTEQRFDAVFVDFPEDTNLAAVRTVSLQFMNDVRRVLNPGGVLVVQDDNPLSVRAAEPAIATARKAGLHALFGDEAEGEVSIQIAAFREAATRDRFLARFRSEYLKDPQYAETVSRYGHLDYKKAEDFDASAKHISFYDPVVLRWNFKDVALAIFGGD